MPSPVRLVVALLAAVLLAGCAGVPTNGPVAWHSPQASEISSGVQVAPLPPAPGASQLLVVEGFLHAMGAAQPDYEVARQYLTRAASQQWQPTSGVQVYADGFPPAEADQTVVLVAPQVGTVDATGSYQTSSGQVRHDFMLVKDDAGQWRISNPPTGLLLSRYLFATGFLPVSLHFLAVGVDVLVPDPRYFAAGPTTSAAAVAAQLAGPSAWLAPAVRGIDTTGISPASVASRPDGTLDIVLAGAGRLNDQQRQQLLAELAYTVAALDGVTGIRVSAGTEPWRAASGQQVVSADSFTSLSPANVSGARALFLAREGRLQRVIDPNDWTRLVDVADGFERPGELAIRNDFAEAAITRQARLETVGLTGTAARTVRTGSGLLQPGYARNDELWSPATSLDRWRVYRDGGEVPVQVRGLPKARVVAARLSPDGIRLAVLLRVAGQTRLGLALVQRGAGGILVSGWRPVEASPATGAAGQLVDVAWAAETDLVVLQHAGTGSSVVRISQDGAEAADIGPSDGTSLTGLAALPGRAVAGLSAGGRLYRFDGRFNWAFALAGVDALAYAG